MGECAQYPFLGPSGAGKTTAINMMCGLLQPDHGQVFIHGRPVDQNGAVSKVRVGLCPQTPILWPKLICLEQLHFVGQLYGLSRPNARRHAGQLIDRLAALLLPSIIFFAAGVVLFQQMQLKR